MRVTTKLRLGTPLVLLLVLGTVALGAEPASAVLPGAADESAMLFAEIPSVYSASKFDQKVTEAPSSVSIVTATEIRQYGYRDLNDILASLRGVYASYDRNYDLTGVRGFLRPGDYNSRILVLIDGVRINDAVYEASAVGSEFPISVELIERVEVVRGPGSVLYGTSAMFAVVNVITKRGRDYQGFELNAKGGSLGTIGGPMSFGKRLGNGVEVLFSGNIYRSRGDDRLYYPEFDDPSTNDGIADNSDDDDFGRFFAKIGYEDFTFTALAGGREKAVPTAPWDTVFNDGRTLTEDKQIQFDAKYEHAFSTQSQLMARLNYSRLDFNGDYAYDYADEGDPPYIVVNKDTTRSKWWGSELQFIQQLPRDHRLTTGAEVRIATEQEQRNFDEEVYLDDDRKLDNWGVYLQDDWEISPKLRASAGVRYDHYDTFGGEMTPRAGLIVMPSERTSLKFLYGEAFRAPSAYELYYHDGEYTTKAANELEPESIQTYEFIWEQYLSNGLRLTGSVYENRIEDLISQDIDPADDLLVFSNISQASARGLELEVEGNWFGSVRGRVSYTFQEAEDDDTGEELSNVPENMIKANVTVPSFGGRLGWGIEGVYETERRTVFGGKADSFFLTNLTVSSNLIDERLGLSASIYNVFDEDYGFVGSTEHAQDVITQDGRTFGLRLSLLF